MARDTSVADRTASFEEAFAEAPRAELPATVQQVMIDERPRGAISVNVKRDELEVLRKIKVIASAAGDDFFYSWPTKNKDGTRGVVEGPSVKCANAVSRIFGNCSVKVRVFDQGPHWIFYAQFYDMETGYVYERPFQQRKGQNIGSGMDKDRATDIVFQIGTSKAARNVVCNALSEFTDYAFAVAKEQLVEKVGKNLEKFRVQVADRLVALKVELVRVEAVRGKPLKDWLATDVAKTIAEIQGVNDGMAHQDELWPPAGAQAGAPKPQQEDFKAEGGNGTQAQGPQGGGGGAGKPAETAAAGSAGGAKAETAAGTPAGEGKQEPAQAAASEAPAADSGKPPPGGTTETVVAAQVDKAEAALQTEPNAQDHGGVVSPGPKSPEELAAAAMEAGEAVLRRGIDNLQAMRTTEVIDDQAPSIVGVIEEIEDLDPEDKAVLLNRWKTAQLERKREIGRKTGKRR